MRGARYEREGEVSEERGQRGMGYDMSRISGERKSKESVELGAIRVREVANEGQGRGKGC